MWTIKAIVSDSCGIIFFRRTERLILISVNCIGKNSSFKVAQKIGKSLRGDIHISFPESRSNYEQYHIIQLKYFALHY